MIDQTGKVSSSFRDPSGFLFYRDAVLYRQINQRYRDDYEHLISCGLYDELAEQRLLVRHREVDLSRGFTRSLHKVIQPEQIAFISYPYEWCFSQLKEAALATLQIQHRALLHDMSLKDASAYNIQFVDGRPILIDTLSFERYREGQPWVAYRQFCQHFLAPLTLMSYRDVRLGLLLRNYIDGIPLDLAAVLLPWRTRLKLSLLAHLYLHARSQERFADDASGRAPRKVSRRGLAALVDNLENTVRGMQWRPKPTEWGNYYHKTNYGCEAMEHKEELLRGFLQKIPSHCNQIWDLGSNTGHFSRIAAEFCDTVLSLDMDAVAVEDNFHICRKHGISQILPLLVDLSNPSPAIGWNNRERDSIFERGTADIALALALIHHLTISNNVPLPMLAEFFHGICEYLIIEFIPKSDSQVQKLLATREDIFFDYTQQKFEETFGRLFRIEEKARIRSSERSLYLMRCNIS